MKSLHHYALALSALLLITALVLFFVDEYIAGGIVLTLFFSTLAYGVQVNSTLKGFSFALVIFATVSFTLCFPEPFTRWGSFELKKLIVPLMQIIMFGMGTGLGVKDFARVLQMPKGVIAGVLCHYIIMPTIAFTITRIFSFPDEIAAGIILIGSCPNGLASNVMTYLARANLALSVTLTAISTFIAPFVTPFFMQLLAGRYVEVNFLKMMMDILQITILPIAAGLVFNYFLAGKFKALDAIMPFFSMFAIALIIAVITAAGRDNLLVVGPLLMVAVLLHNISGYFLGYWSGRLLRMKESDCRTIAIEVGMQNGGLASGIALQMGKVATVGLAAVIFSPVMNITGSLLASWWRNKPIEE
jgi:BASS family bile acid:Na+ symporter